MKKYKSIFICLSCLIGFAGCKRDILNQPPKDKLTDASVWSDLSLANLYLNDAYNGVPSGFERGFYLLDAATDEAETGYPWAYSQNFNQSDFTPTNPIRFAASWDGGPPTPWVTDFLFIRKTNVFLSKIDGVPGDDSAKSVLKGEARFLRALFYHELVKLYGGVPIINTVQSIDNLDSLLVKRNTVDECVDFIVSDLDAAAAVLPDKRTGKDVGRASKAAALALKGRQLLYAERWTASASASKQAMEIPGYSLFPDYEQMFWAANNNNNEVY
ncbi:MAG: RagB/SusD family nutrient uptake outer membrane protein, partial [Chitinophagaceae bacterium]|nr:RagB/SusD family nutrient uptake outer membrane protein [Chitinophagaceae bacterium]